MWFTLLEPQSKKPLQSRAFQVKLTFKEQTMPLRAFSQWYICLFVVFFPLVQTGFAEIFIEQ